MTGTHNDRANFEALQTLYDKLSNSSLGLCTPWTVEASGGKPLLYGGRRGMLARGSIATWDEFDFIAALVNAAPDLLAGQLSPAGWIVTSGDGKRFRHWGDGYPAWTTDRSKATRYARREDAEAVHREDEDAWRVVPYAEPAEATRCEDCPPVGYPTDDPHRFAVVSANFGRPFLLGAYETLEAAQKAQCSSPDKWPIYERVPPKSEPSPDVEALKTAIQSVRDKGVRIEREANACQDVGASLEAKIRIKVCDEIAEALTKPEGK